jgi:hypothetical protein
MSRILSIATGTAFAVLVTTAYGQDESLSGLKELKIAFDVTTGNSDALVRELDVIDETRQSLMKQGIKPSIVIGFRSGATKLVQTDQSKIKPEDRSNAQAIAAKIRTLHTADGIAGIEQCSIAARLVRHQAGGCRSGHNGGRQWMDFLGSISGQGMHLHLGRLIGRHGARTRQHRAQGGGAWGRTEVGRKARNRNADRDARTRDR